MASEKGLHRLESLLAYHADRDGFDYAIKIEVGPDWGWVCEVRITPKPNDHGHPDRSLVTYSAGNATAWAVAQSAVHDALKWFGEWKEEKNLLERVATMEAEIATLRAQLHAPVLS
jgi:hypothetical protein